MRSRPPSSPIPRWHPSVTRAGQALPRASGVATYDAILAAVFPVHEVASVEDTSGEGVATGKWGVDKVSRTSTFQDPKRPGLVKLFADRERRILVGGLAVGPEAGEWIGQITLAVRARVPVELLRDTPQPFPTFSESIYFTARELDL